MPLLSPFNSTIALRKVALSDITDYDCYGQSGVKLCSHSALPAQQGFLPFSTLMYQVHNGSVIIIIVGKPI